MIITKLFEFEGSHIVRNCTSKRCAFSIHGHSYKVEISLEATHLDNGQMVYDFGLMKGPIKDFIDSFDHTHVLWSKEDQKHKDYFFDNYQRVIEIPVSPSAEMLSALFFSCIRRILECIEYNNGEKDVSLHSVKIWETRTGSATANIEDSRRLFDQKWFLEDIRFSDGIKSEWSDINMWNKILERQVIPMPKAEQQIK